MADRQPSDPVGKRGRQNAGLRNHPGRLPASFIVPVSPIPPDSLSSLIPAEAVRTMETMEIAQSSPNTPTEGAQKKRRRTEAQLARKRQADRINHKAKREQQKRQMESLETQVTNLQEAVQSLTDQVRVLNERLRDQTRYFSCFDIGETPSPVAAASNSSASFSQPRPLPNAHDMLLLPADKLPMLVPTPAIGEPDNNVPVDCRCGVDHRSYYECLEYSTFSILLRAHQGLNKSISNSTRLPRTPSLVHVFRPTSTDNPVIQILGLVFSQVRPANVRTLFACYVVMYRFLRVRLIPCLSSSSHALVTPS